MRISDIIENFIKEMLEEDELAIIQRKLEEKNKIIYKSK